MADFVTVAEDFVIIKITQFSDFVKKGSKLQGTAHTSILNARPILLYINNQSELLLKQVISIFTCFSDFSDKNLFWSC